MQFLRLIKASLIRVHLGADSTEERTGDFWISGGRGNVRESPERKVFLEFVSGQRCITKKKTSQRREKQVVTKGDEGRQKGRGGAGTGERRREARRAGKRGS